MEHIQHAGALASRPESGEEPVEAVGVGEDGAVGVVPLDNCRQQLVQVACERKREKKTCKVVS